MPRYGTRLRRLNGLEPHPAHPDTCAAPQVRWGHRDDVRAWQGCGPAAQAGLPRSMATWLASHNCAFARQPGQHQRV